MEGRGCHCLGKQIGKNMTKEEISCWTKEFKHWKNANHRRQLLSRTKSQELSILYFCQPSNLLSYCYFGKEFPPSWPIFSPWGFLWLTDQQVLKKPVAEISQTQCAHLTSVTVTVVSLNILFLNQEGFLCRVKSNRLFRTFLGNYFSIETAYAFVNMLYYLWVINWILY